MPGLPSRKVTTLRELGGGGGVLGGVGQRLGDDVVGGELDRIGQPTVEVDVKADGDGGAAGQRLDVEDEGHPSVAENSGSSIALTALQVLTERFDDDFL